MIAAIERRRPATGGIVLPRADARRPDRALDRAALDDAIEAGRGLGFVSRDPVAVEPEPVRRKPGPRRRERQDRLSVSGPRRITGAFRAYCTRLGLTHWEGLARLMRAAPTTDDASPRSTADGAVAAAARSAASRSADGPCGSPLVAGIVMPATMLAWIDARVRASRYLDAGDYIRALVRRDQEDERGILAREAEIRATTEAGDRPA